MGIRPVLAPTKIDLAGRPAPTSIRHPRPRNGPRSPPCWGMKGLPRTGLSALFRDSLRGESGRGQSWPGPRRAVMPAEFVVR